VSEWLHTDLNPHSGKATTYGFTPAPPLHDNKEEEEEKGKQLPWNASHVGNMYHTLKVQGILALKDCSKDDGGFQCVPGFHKSIRWWCKENEEHCVKSANGYDSTTVQIPKTDVAWKHIQHMPVRRGSLLVWNGCLPHGTFPNDSNSPRIIQYIRCLAASDRAVQPYEFGFRFGPEEQLPFDQGFELTELGRKLYGFDKWPSSWDWKPRGNLVPAMISEPPTPLKSDELRSKPKAPTGFSRVAATRLNASIILAFIMLIISVTVRWLW